LQSKNVIFYKKLVIENQTIRQMRYIAIIQLGISFVFFINGIGNNEIKVIIKNNIISIERLDTKRPTRNKRYLSI
jgi:hypothetical protein